MNLKVREFDSKGKHYVNYVVQKLNEEGVGLLANTELAIKLAFDIRVQKNQWTDDKGVTKIIVSILATGSPSITFDNVVLNEYGNATFQLPANLETVFANAKKGDTLFLALKPFEMEIDGKKQKRSKWIGAVNQRLDLTEKKDNRTAMSMPKKAATTSTTNEWADDLKAVIKFCLSDPASFKESFYVADNKTKPQDFIDWMKSNSEVTTKLDDGQLICLYWEIVEMIK
jgi:hypothetical protein